MNKRKAEYIYSQIYNQNVKLQKRLIILNIKKSYRKTDCFSMKMGQV